MHCCLHMLDHRVQILLDEARYRKVAAEAARRGQSIAAVVREAIDRLPTPVEQRQTAIDLVLAAEPIDLPTDPLSVRRELDAAHDRLAE